MFLKLLRFARTCQLHFYFLLNTNEYSSEYYRELSVQPIPSCHTGPLGAGYPTPATGSAALIFQTVFFILIFIEVKKDSKIIKSNHTLQWKLCFILAFLTPLDGFSSQEIFARGEILIQALFAEQLGKILLPMMQVFVSPCSSCLTFKHQLERKRKKKRRRKC